MDRFKTFLAIGLYLIALLVIGSFGEASLAEDLFYDSCVAQGYASEMIYLAKAGGPNLGGLTCEDLKNIGDKIDDIQMVLYPASLAIILSPARDEIIAELSALGLSMANPAVLGVTIIGATGAGVIYLVLKKTFKECEALEREQIKESILEEIEHKYGIRAPRAELELRRR